MRLAFGLVALLLTLPTATAQRYGESAPPAFAQSGVVPQGGHALQGGPGPQGGQGDAPLQRIEIPAMGSGPLQATRSAAAPPAGAPLPVQRPSATPGDPPPRTQRYTPATLMTGMFRAPAAPRLAGQPVKLEEVISAGSTRAEQTQLIYAYWDLCSSTVDYYLGLAEANELGRLRQQAGNGSAALNEAVEHWRTRIETSRLAATAAQRRLASMMSSASLPLPGDKPLCGAYTTRYAEVFAGRGSQEAQVLAQLIPLRYDELTEAAAAVQRSELFAESVKQRDPTGEGMVRALELLALSRRAFVQIAKDYNRQITRYTELATPGRVDTDRLVAMLVERPSNATAASGARPLTFRRGLQ